MTMPGANPPSEKIPPQKRTRRWSKLLAILLLLALVGGLALFLRWRDEQAKLDFAPPVVLINEPSPGSTIVGKDPLAVAASAFGLVPIRRAELWVDGQLIDSRSSATPGGISPFYANFTFVPNDGPHSIVVRAVNAAEIIGQSLPYQFLAIGKTSVALAPTTPLTATVPITGPTSAPPTQPVTAPLPPGFLPPSLAPPLTGTQPSGVGGPPGGDGGNPPGGGAGTPPGPPLPPADPNPSPLDQIVSLVPGIAPFFAPPTAPTNLIATLQNCKIRLVWKDNSNNEKEFDVWMKGSNLPPRVIATLKPALGGTAWFEFDAPAPGYYTFWVEAVSAGGKQPSNQFGPILIPQQCPSTLATNLDVQLSNLKIGANGDKAYCYASFQNLPEIKMPVGINEFFRPFAGVWAWFPGPIPPPGTGLLPGFEVIGSFAVPVPGGGALMVSGECWMWSGKDLKKVGTFGITIPQKDWDCKPHEIDGGVVKVTIKLCQGGALSVQNPGDSYGFDDPSIPSPYDVAQGKYYGIGPLDPHKVPVRWKWSGDQNKIMGFIVYYNGTPYQTLYDRTLREIEGTLPALCGLTNKWEVAALTQTSQSPKSDPFVDKQDPCTGWAAVRFRTIDFKSTVIVGGINPSLPCDNMYMAYRIGLNSTYRDMSNRQFVSCGSHLFVNLASFENPGNPQSQTVIVPIDPKAKIGIQIYASFYEHSNLVANHYLPLEFASWTDAIAQTDQCGKIYSSDDQRNDIASTMSVGLSFYPNICSATPHD